MLRIFGTINSRTARTIWMAEELGVPYRLEAVDFQTRQTRSPEFLAINPNGHVPAIDDDGLRLSESIAINLYLARKHADSPIAPRGLVEEGRTLTWSLFAVNELESSALAVLMHGRILPAERRDAGKLARARGALGPPLGVLELTLAGGGPMAGPPGRADDEPAAPQPYLIGQRFTVADLNVASVLDWARAAPDLLKAYPGVSAWLQRCFARDAYGRVRAMRRVTA